MLSLMGVQGCGRFRQDSASSAAWGRGFASLGGICGSEHWDFQLPLLIHVAALASGIWKRDIAAIIETSEVCTYSSGRYILFSFFPPFSFLFFLPLSIKFWGQKHPVLVLTGLTTDRALHSSTPLMSCLCQRGLIV